MKAWFSKNRSGSKKAAIAAVTAVTVGVQNAAAAVSIDFTEATTDMATVFTAILGVGVIIYGYRKIRGMIGA